MSYEDVRLKPGDTISGFATGIVARLRIGKRFGRTKNSGVV